MTDLFIEWEADQVIVVYDSDHNELWRGDWRSIGLLRALADAGVIGLYESEAQDDRTK